MRLSILCKLLLILPVTATFGCTSWNLDGNGGTDPGSNFLGTTDTQPLVIKTNDNEAMRIDTSGNVGIGTTAPQSKLHVNSGADAVSVRVASNTVASAIAFHNSSVSSDSVMVGAQANSLRFITDGMDRVAITENGDVGIGTVTPGAKLEVNGQVKITGGNPGANRVLTSDGNGLASWRPPFSLVVRSSQTSVGAASLRVTGVDCRANETATGGGFGITDDTNLHVWDNRPKTDGSGWTVSISNYGSVSRSFRVYAVCLRTS